MSGSLRSVWLWEGCVRKLAVVLAGSLVASLLAFSPASAGSFDDVPEGVWFEDAVEWLASAGITTGTGEREFSPNEFVTRAQMAAFLARFAEASGGSPSSGFGDVPAGAWFEEPVDWLVERGITTGTSASTYSPNDLVTRAQMAAFLWRFVGRTPSDLVLPFSDVPAGTWYTDAVRWLAEAGVTAGTSPTTYSPNDPVTRAQMAVFLHRLAGEPAAGEPGNGRVAAIPMAASGGSAEHGDASVVFGGLTSDGYVRIVVGEGASLPPLDEPVSDEVEIVVTDAALDGPLTVTVRITIDARDAVGLVVFVLDDAGRWHGLELPVFTNAGSNPTVATFTLPASVPLAPTSFGVSAFAGVQSRVVARLAQRLPDPRPPAAVVMQVDLSAIPVGVNLGASVDATVGITGGRAPFRFDASGLPPGLAIDATGTISGVASEAGSFAVSLEVSDSSGQRESSELSMTVVGHDQEHSFVRWDAADYSLETMVSPDGRFLAFQYPDLATVSTFDLDLDAMVDQVDDVRSNGFPGESTLPLLSADGRYLTINRDGSLVQTDALGATRVIASNEGSYRFVVASDDGRFVAFSSQLSLVPGDPVCCTYYGYLWDRNDGSYVRLTTGEGHTIASMTRDGRLLAIERPHSGTVLYDRENGGFRFLGGLVAPRLAGDGSAVFGADESGALVRYDVGTTRTTVVAASYERDAWRDIAVSEDGRFVSFTSREPLVLPDDSTTEDLFQWDASTGVVQRITEPGVYDPDNAAPVRASGDGAIVLFWSSESNITPAADRNGPDGVDLFLWDRSLDVVQRVTGGGEEVCCVSPQISRDGSVVAFMRGSGATRALLVWGRD